VSLSSTDTLQSRCADLVHKLGLALPEDISSVQPLTGGVASDIAAVDFSGRKVCVKFALSKLRVADDWHASIDRNSAEYAWLEFAGRAVPGSVPALFGRDADLNGFAMEFVKGEDIYNWKTQLMQRRPRPDEAAKAGEVLGKIHAASTAPDFDAVKFQNQDSFYELRLEPYFGFTAQKHPELRSILEQLITRLQEISTVLIHGDVSPKNILFRDGQPVFLDAECATMGDPAFDVAFCMNHLMLNWFHFRDTTDDFLLGVTEFWDGYWPHVCWEDASALEKRICELLPALLLARVDGKSPVEYLDEDNQKRVRHFAIAVLTDPPASLAEFKSRGDAVLEVRP
jgi:aminoglycoside phosphotransferase (APT) family kinase protein